MALALIITIIAMIPLLMGIALFNIYGKNNLTFGVFAIMFALSAWQVDVAILYFLDFLPKEIILILFKTFRFGIIFSIPPVFYLAKISLNLEGNNMKSQTVLQKVTRLVVSNKFLYPLYAWSIILYIILWTPLGVSDLKIIEAEGLNTNFYYPEVGPLGFLLYVHFAFYILGLVFALIAIKSIINPSVRTFMRTFMYSSIAVYILALFNMNPNNGILIGSIGVILFSIFIAVSFIKMYNGIVNNYNIIVERQNKLDYVGNITSSLIHEVKNGLAIIQGYSQILSMKQNFNDETQEYLGYIQMASTQLADFVKGYQEFLINQKIEFSDKNLYKALEKSITMAKTYIEDNNFEIKLTGDKKIKAYINETYITQVFLNLIKNSIEATSDEKRRKIINIVLHQNADFSVINFQDKGKGIPKDNWEKVFSPFNSDKTHGTGLGLPFCKNIIFSHHGEIHIIESDNNGTLFQIKLPRYKFSKYVEGETYNK